MLNYFLYARKSTDVEDKQVRSIEDQLSVLRALAKTEGLTIAEEFVEKQSAKKLGRPVFNEMLMRIERGEAQGIVCWKLDRLARNPVDGGQIQWFLQRGILQHIQTHDRSYRPTDNFMLMSVEFGMANQFILDLSANTKRGLHEKVKRGEYPSLAPIGYLNDRIKKTIVVDKHCAKIVRQAFELYAEGDKRLEDVAEFFAKHNFLADTGKPFKLDRITYILSNPFYCGFFRYAKELHEGTHTPIITKKLFDKVQEVLKKRGKPCKPKNEPKPLCGLFRCGECGCFITAEEKIKHQKNGNTHRYVYYHCTKRKGRCSQPCIREEELDGQLSAILEKFAMPEAWASELEKLAEADEQETLRTTANLTQEARTEIQSISQKIQRLFTLYFEQDIEREMYLTEKADLLGKKKSLEEKIDELLRGSISWLEPLRNWIKDAKIVGELRSAPLLSSKKSSFKKIVGSNPLLKDKKIEFVPISPYASLCEARKNFSENDLSMISERDTGIGPAPLPWQGSVLPLY